MEPFANIGQTRETAAARYETLAQERMAFLRRARECSELTIPSLIPPEGHSGTSDFVTPFQSVGARGSNNLAAKLLLALFPPGGSFFRLEIDTFDLANMAAKARENGATVEDARAEFDLALSQYERATVNRMEQEGVRATQEEALKHAIVGGNALVKVLDRGGARMWPLSQYVVKRDKEGNPLEMLVKESISKRALPEEIREHVSKAASESTSPTSGQREDEVDIFTWVQRDGKVWNVHQEVGGAIVPDSEGTYPLEKCPFIPLRWTSVAGEDYGRGLVEEYLGDLRSLETLTQAIVEGSAAAAKILLFVDEAAHVTAKEVAEAPSGAVLEGNANSVTILQMQKYADFRIAKETADQIEQRLEQAFLLFTSIQRNGERVSATEIRTLAGELEQSLGGVYSVMAQEFQRPLAARVMHVLEKEGKLKPLPDGTVSPKIVAGLEGLGRSSDLMKLDAFLGGLQQTFGPEAVSTYVNVGAYAKRRAAALGLDPAGLIRSEEEVQQMRQQAAQQQMIEKLGGPAIKAMSDQATAAQQQQQPA